MTIQRIYAIRDTCAEVYHLPMFFTNRASAVRALGDVVNRPGQDNAYYQHPEHYQLYELGAYDDNLGDIQVLSAPVFVVDCQSLVLDNKT